MWNRSLRSQNDTFKLGQILKDYPILSQNSLKNNLVIYQG